MKTFTHDIRYDGVTPAQVFEMLKTPAFREAVCEYQRYMRHTVTITPEGDGMSVFVDQYRTANEVPSFARKIVGEEINVAQRESWSSPTDATLKIEIPGKPGEMSGTVHMRDVDGGTTETVTLTVKVNIPLIGGKLEDFIGTMLIRALNAENKVGVKWLAGA